MDLLNGLQRRVLREEFIDYVVRGLQEELRKRHESLNAQLELARNEKRQIEGELRRLVESIAALHSSPTIVAAITEREAKLRPITHKLIEFIARAD